MGDLRKQVSQGGGSIFHSSHRIVYGDSGQHLQPNNEEWRLQHLDGIIEQLPWIPSAKPVDETRSPCLKTVSTLVD